jgi:hypothetical protein
MTTRQKRVSKFVVRLWLAAVVGFMSLPAEAINTMVVPGKPTSDNSPIAIVNTYDVKMSHKPITVGEYVFVPKVGKCWNVGHYKLRRGTQVLAHGVPDKWWPNSTYFTVITPLIVPSAKVLPRKLGSNPGFFVDNVKAPLKVVVPGYNVCGSGSPEMIVERANCGAKCLYEYFIFSLGKNFKQVTKLESGNDPINFIDIGGDGTIEGIGIENTFDCWNYSSASSPRFTVALRVKNGKVRLATDLMKTPPPSAAYMNKIVAETKAKLVLAKDEKGNDTNEIIAPFELVTNMLELIYSGNGESAMEFVDQVWPNQDVTWESTLPRRSVNKQQFIAEVKGQLAKSPYWHDVKTMNNW